MNLFRLQKIREEQENTQKEVADILNVQRGTYASWECGSDMISTKKMFEFANYYQKSVDYILGLTDFDHTMIHTSSIDLSAIGRRLTSIRKKFGLSQLQFAERIGINQSTWWAYEKGKTLITISSLVELATEYHCSVDWILGRTKNEFLK